MEKNLKQIKFIENIKKTFVVEALYKKKLL